MNKILIYISLIHVIILTTTSNAHEENHLIDPIQKLLKPTLCRPLPPRPTEETEFLELLTIPISRDDFRTFLDLNTPERPSTPTPINNSQNEMIEGFIASPFHMNFNPINPSPQQSLTLPPFNFKLIPSKNFGNIEKIMSIKLNQLNKNDRISLRILIILRTTLIRHTSQENCSEYKKWIDEKVQEHEP